jgi:hypothetical protein
VTTLFYGPVGEEAKNLDGGVGGDPTSGRDRRDRSGLPSVQWADEGNRPDAPLNAGKTIVPERHQLVSALGPVSGAG